MASPSEDPAQVTAGLPPVHEAWLPREHPLHRPRHGRRQLLSLVVALVFFATPLAARAVGPEPAEFENRRLAVFPSLTQGWDFWPALSSWASDNLVFRQDAVHAADFISRAVFGEPLTFDGHRDRSGPIGIDQDRESHDVTVPSVIEGREGWLYFGEDIVARCKQTNSLDVTMAQLDKLREGVESSGRRFIALIAPDKTTMVPQYLPPSYSGKDCRERVTADLWRRVAEGGYILDLRDSLRRWESQIGRPVYPKIDTHWADEGGLAMTEAIAEAVQPGVSAGWQIAPSRRWRVPGDLPPLIGRTGDMSGTFYALRPDGVTNRATAVPTDFTDARTPLHLTHAQGAGTISGRVGLIGDSFAINALRYLGATFSDITIVHAGRAETEGSQAMAELLVQQEVVVLEMVERTVAAGNHVLLGPEVVDAIITELNRHPIR